jgi:hypothetical protein
VAGTSENYITTPQVVYTRPNQVIKRVTVRYDSRYSSEADRSGSYYRVERTTARRFVGGIGGEVQTATPQESMCGRDPPVKHVYLRRSGRKEIIFGPSQN